MLTPKLIKDISIATGLAEEIIQQLLEPLAPVARGALIRLIIEGQQ